MDALANIMILTPLFMPIVKELAIDPVHFGIVMIISIAMGFLTPPVGVNIFVGCGISKIRIEQLSYAMPPFMLAIIITLLVLFYVPAITLRLPNTMG
jgi:C4-dicarboxylate transporter DctM subunit